MGPLKASMYREIGGSALSQRLLSCSAHLIRLFWILSGKLQPIHCDICRGNLVNSRRWAPGPNTARGRLLRSLIAPTMGTRDLASLSCLAPGGHIPDLPKKAGVTSYLQQYQMARFVSRYYPSGRVVAHDIGALTYFSHVHVLDLFGLAPDSVRDLWLSGHLNTVAITPLIDNFHPDLVAVYPQWYRRDWALPKVLIPVGSWTRPSLPTH